MIRGIGRYQDEIRLRYLAGFAFVHINKTGGSSVERALGLPFRHLTAPELRAAIGATRWKRWFSFTIVRNPWDKVASHYHYRVRTNQTALRTHPVAFGEWVRLTYGEQDRRYFDSPKMFMPQTDWLVDEEGKIMVEFIGRFERLEQDFRTICHRIGRDAQLPHLKKSERGDYRTLYTDATTEIVGKWFARDLANFNYSFE